MNAALFIAYFSAGSVMVPLSIAFFSWRQSVRRVAPLVVLLVASMMSDGISVVLFNRSLNSYFFVNVFLLVQFLCCYVMLTRWDSPRGVVNQVFLIVCSFLFFANLFLGQGIGVFNSYSNSTFGLILIFASLRYFYRLLRDLPEADVYRIPEFWIAAAILSYYAGTLLLFVVNNYLTMGVGGSHQAVWILHNLVNVLKNLFFAIALWHNYHSRRSSTF